MSSIILSGNLNKLKFSVSKLSRHDCFRLLMQRLAYRAYLISPLENKKWNLWQDLHISSNNR